MTNKNPKTMRKNGLMCPTCSSELYDSCPEVILTSCPPQRNVHCEACGYTGYEWAKPVRAGYTIRHKAITA